MSHGGCKYFLAGVGIVGLVVLLLAVVGLGIYLVLNPTSPTAQSLPAPVSGPEVAFQEPAPGTRVPLGSSLLVFATARDAKRVTRVDLWIDDQLVIQQAAPDPAGVTPLSLIHSLTAVAPGTYRLLARAYNGEGVMGESPVLQVTVVNEVVSPPAEANRIVQPGETPEQIAQEHGTTVEELEQKNPEMGKEVKPGQVVVVPAPGAVIPPSGGAPPPAAPPPPGAPPKQGGGLAPGGANPPGAGAVAIKRADGIFEMAPALVIPSLQRSGMVSLDQLMNPSSARLRAPELLEPKVGDCQVTLAWQDTSGQNPTFDIVREGGDALRRSLPQNLPAGTQTYQDKVPNAGRYIYQVVAYAKIGSNIYRAKSNPRQVVVPPAAACVPARTQYKLVYFQPTYLQPAGALRVTIGEITRRLPHDAGNFLPPDGWRGLPAEVFPAPPELYGDVPALHLEVNALSWGGGLANLGTFQRAFNQSELQREQEWKQQEAQFRLDYRLWVEDLTWTGKGTTDRLPAPTNLRHTERADGQRVLDWGWLGERDQLEAFILYRAYSCPDQKSTIQIPQVLPKTPYKFEISVGSEPVGCAASYQVSAFGSPGESAPSNTVFANTAPAIATAQVTFKDVLVARATTSEIVLIAGEHLRKSKPTILPANTTLPLDQIKFSGQNNVMRVPLARDQTLNLNFRIPEIGCNPGALGISATMGDWKKFGQKTEIIQSKDAQNRVECKMTVEIKVVDSVAPPPPPRSAQCPGAPSVTFSASPKTINAGQAAKLQWQVTNADKIEIDQGIGVVAASDSKWVNPSKDTRYTLKATGCGGTETKSAEVKLLPAPPACPDPPRIETFSASRLSITAGESTELSWTVKHATSTEIDGKAATSPYKVTPLTTTEYTLTARGCGTPATQKLKVTVNQPAAPIGCPNDFYNLGCGNVDVANKVHALYDKLLIGYTKNIELMELNIRTLKIGGIPYSKGCQVTLGGKQVRVYCEKLCASLGSKNLPPGTCAAADTGMYEIIDALAKNTAQIKDATMRGWVEQYLRLAHDHTTLCLTQDADDVSDAQGTQTILDARRQRLNALAAFYNTNIKSHANQNPNR